MQAGARWEESADGKIQNGELETTTTDGGGISEGKSRQRKMLTAYAPPLSCVLQELTLFLNQS